MTLWKSLLCYLLLLFAEKFTSGKVTVKTSRGDVHGFHIDYGANTSNLFYGSADVFLGIPFAKPPIGNLRFRLPRAICSYGKKGVNATAYGPSCPQAEYVPQERSNPKSEDCLYINVMSPTVRGPAKYPVLVWIHGGRFETGSASSYDYKGAIRQFVSKGVVVVTIQYRLGILGFFPTFTPDFPANRAIFDQVMALRWVQQEIAVFGGDPYRVTIFGESAGASSVSTLSLSPRTKGLFHQLIVESTYVGLDTIDTPMPSTNKHQAQLLCNFTNAQWATGDFSPLVSCLKDIPWQGFTNRSMGVTDGTAFNVALDGFFLPDALPTLVEARPNYPTLLGDMQDEFAWAMNKYRGPNPTNLSAFSPDFLPKYILTQFPYMKDKIDSLSDIVLRVFKRGRRLTDQDGEEWFKIAIEAMSSMTFTSAGRLDANWHLANGNPNVFLFTYAFPGSLCSNTVYNGWRPVPHASELCYVWFQKNAWESAANSSKLTPNDFRIADFFANAWSNFVKNSKPLPDWPAVSSREEMEFYRIMVPDGRVESHFREDTDVVFNSVFPSLLGEFPVQSMSKESSMWLKKHYVPSVRAEYERFSVCK